MRWASPTDRFRLELLAAGIVALLALSAWPVEAAETAGTRGAGTGAAATEAASKSEPKPFDPIPLTDVAIRAEQAKLLLEDVQEALRPKAEFETVETEISQLSSRVNLQLKGAQEIISAGPSLATTEEYKLRLEGLRAEVGQLLQKTRVRSLEIEHQIERIRQTQGEWAATLADAKAKDSPKEVVAAIGGVQAAAQQVMSQGRKRQGLVVRLERRIAALAGELERKVKLLDATRLGLMGQILERDAPPFWSPQAYASVDAGGMLEAVRSSQIRDWGAIRTFAAANRGSVALYAIVITLLAVAMISVRGRTRALATSEGTLGKVVAVFESPISMALLIGVMLSNWIFPLMPQPMRHVLGAVFLIPAVLILRRLLDRALFPIMYALVGFYFVDRVRDLLAPVPPLTRGLFLVEMTALIAVALWWTRSSHTQQLASGSDRSPMVHAVVWGARVALIGGTLGFLAQVAGYGSLADTVAGATLFPAYVALILFATKRVAEGMVALALRLRPLRLLGMVQRHRSLLERRSFRFAGWVAAFYWAVVVLREFELSAPVARAATGMLETELKIGELAISLADVLVLGLVIWASFLISRLLRFVLEEDVYTRLRLSKGMPYATSTLAHYAILVIGFGMAMAAVGIKFDRFLILAGAFSVGIGFGLQNIVNNFVSGLILLTERPVDVGDSVTLSAGDVFGRVERIGIRSSTVRTWQGAEVIVPNSALISEQVTNWTHSDHRRRIEIPVGVAYGSRPERVMAVLLEVAKSHPQILPGPEPEILFTGFGDSSLDFELRAWTNQFDSFLRVRSDLCVGIEAALAEAGITIPFPQRDLHIKTGDTGSSSEGSTS
ncbi:MAG: mechanosensitive ion channel [Deltaproteobacteria bacterium]|nr:mechanosensitive ion channel [Deltaproteobacteria bacterium]